MDKKNNGLKGNESNNLNNKDYEAQFKLANENFANFKNDFLKLYGEFEQTLTKLIICLAEVNEFSETIKRPPQYNDLRYKKISEVSNKKSALQETLIQIREPIEVLLGFEDIKDRLKLSKETVMLTQNLAHIFLFPEVILKRKHKILAEKIYRQEDFKSILDEFQTAFFIFLQIANPLIRKLH